MIQIFRSFSGCSKFPLDYCSTKWLNNGPVAKRSVAFLPHVKKYIKTVGLGTDASASASAAFKVNFKKNRMMSLRKQLFTAIR